MPAGWVAAGTGLASALGVFGNGPQNTMSSLSQTNPFFNNGVNMGNYDTNQMTDPYNAAQYQQYTNQQLNNPYAAQYQTGANVGGSMLTGAGNQAYGAGGNLYGMGNTEMGAANQALTTAFDPNQALYNQYLSNTQNQSAAANAMSGVSNSPYGGGVTGQNLTNFNIGWDQNQLSNQLAGLQAYNTAAGGVGSTYNNAAGLQSGGAAAVNQGMGMPYTATNTLAQNNINALNAQLGGAQSGNNLLNQQAQNYYQSAGFGLSGNTQALNAAQDAQMNQQQAIAGFGGLALQGLNAYQNYNNPSSSNSYLNNATNWSSTPSYTSAPASTYTYGSDYGSWT